MKVTRIEKHLIKARLHNEGNAVITTAKVGKIVCGEII